MQSEEALAILDTVLPDHPLSNLQETVFSQVWEGRTYAEIAEMCGYEPSYIRDVGFRLWQTLSAAFGQKISKSNLRAVLSRYRRSYPTESRQSQGASPPAALLSADLEFPNGPVPLHSELYIERPPIEAQTFADIVKPGSLIRLKAPRLMGKTSLMRRIVAFAQSHSMQTITLSFRRADQTIYGDLDRFLRWFCANISYQLGMDADLDACWNHDVGSKVSCTIYLENQILSRLAGPLVIALDDVNELFQYPKIAAEFLPLLRSWYEDAREVETWQCVRWVLAHTTDVYVPLKLSQSPFNVGLAIKLPSFSLEQVKDLASRHQITWVNTTDGPEKLLSLLSVVSCRPGLVRLALYYLAHHRMSLAQLIEEAPTQSGIYSGHLRDLLAALYPHPDLQLAFQAVIQSSEPVVLEPLTAYRLESLGLISLQKNQATPSCELYRRYFLDFLPLDKSSTYV